MSMFSQTYLRLRLPFLRPGVHLMWKAPDPCSAAGVLLQHLLLSSLLWLRRSHRLLKTSPLLLRRSPLLPTTPLLRTTEPRPPPRFSAPRARCAYGDFFCDSKQVSFSQQMDVGELKTGQKGLVILLHEFEECTTLVTAWGALWVTHLYCDICVIITECDGNIMHEA